MKTTFLYSILILLALLLISCSSNTQIDTVETGISEEIKHTIIIYVHGDADYLYYTDKNEAVHADEVSVQKAIDVAKDLTNSEVFIFHQKRKEYFLFFFPKDDKEFYYYRNGRQLVQQTYETPTDNLLDKEIEFIDRYTNTNKVKDHSALYLYFGHQIPEKSETGYFISYPQKEIGIDSLTEKLNEIRERLALDYFDTIVLSTCLSGTPYVAEKFTTLTKNLIASPEDLHLSYMDIEFLKNLNDNNYDEEKFSEAFALSSYIKLKNHTKTVVSIAKYDLNVLRNKLTAYMNLSCSETIDSLSHQEGVSVYYQPPQFGRQKNKKQHTGWNCAK